MLKAPFPWFGGKSRAAELIWQGLGNPLNYVEPFAGSLAVLLNRPNFDLHVHVETVNDIDCYLANFWRCIRLRPEETAEWASWPVNEADLSARHKWLCNQEAFRDAMKTDPDYCDPKIAGWWVWGLCAWIGSGWCANGQGRGKLPRIGDAGTGINRQLPHLSTAGAGIHRQLSPEALDSETCVRQYFETLAQRLRRVRVACGDWSRVLSYSATTKIGVTGLLLDPPYSHTGRYKVYSDDSKSIFAETREWAIEHGDDPDLRIILCGYEDDFIWPDNWREVKWLALGGYGNQGDSNNRVKETLWLSPACLPVSGAVFCDGRPQATIKKQLSFF